MFGGINPAQMKSMMKQMGIKQETLEVTRVIIETASKNIIIEPASVEKITMKGEISYQIAGESREESKAEGIKEEDIAMVSEKSGKSLDESRTALEESGGDIAEAIIKLSE